MERRCVLVGYGGDEVNEYNLSTAYDVSTASYVHRYYVITNTQTATGMSFNNDGTKMYIANTYSSYDDIDEYSLSTAFDVSELVILRDYLWQIEKVILMEYLIMMEQKCLL